MGYCLVLAYTKDAMEVLGGDTYAYFRLTVTDDPHAFLGGWHA